MEAKEVKIHLYKMPDGMWAFSTMGTVGDGYQTLPEAIDRAKEVALEAVSMLEDRFERRYAGLSGQKSESVPVVLVLLRNGVADVFTDRPCRVVILEHDEDMDPRNFDGHDFVLWDDVPFFFLEWEIQEEEADPALPEKVERARRCPRCEACGYPRPRGEYFCKENSFAKLCADCAGDDDVLVND